MESCYFPLLADNTNLVCQVGWRVGSYDGSVGGFWMYKEWYIYSIGQSDYDSYVRPFVCVSMSERIFIKIFWSNVLLCCALWKEQSPLFCVTFCLKGNKKERSFGEGGTKVLSRIHIRSGPSSPGYLLRRWLGLVSGEREMGSVVRPRGGPASPSAGMNLEGHAVPGTLSHLWGLVNQVRAHQSG